MNITEILSQGQKGFKSQMVYHQSLADNHSSYDVHLALAALLVVGRRVIDTYPYPNSNRSAKDLPFLK